MSDGFNIRCVRYDEIETTAKWIYYATKALANLRKRSTKLVR